MRLRKERPSAIRAPSAWGLVILSAALTGGGCAHLGVQPWEREQLARKETPIGSDPVEAELDDHIYFSKKASRGGRGFVGGGCGGD